MENIYFVLRSKRSNQVSDYNKHVNMPFNKVITSNNVLIQDNNHSTSSVWEWKASLSPKSQEKMSHTPVKKYPNRNKIPRPGPTRNKIPRPDPTRKYSLKCSPTPDRFRSGPVRSGETRGFGLPRRSLISITQITIPYILRKSRFVLFLMKHTTTNGDNVG